MIVVTGGAGFIGSAVIWGLNRRNIRNIMVVDHLDKTDKWKNLVPLQFLDYMDRDAFLDGIRNDVLPDNISCVIHMGACTDTLNDDASYLIQNNFKYSQAIASYCLNKHIRLIYASSVATYGDGTQGFSDLPDDLDKLRPLNPYGYSKHLFDLWASRNGILDEMIGLKFANVFGPNEGHKGEMVSMIHNCLQQIEATNVVRLFRSHHPEYPDGGQKRDFVYIKDVVDMVLFFLDKPEINGLFNAGSGHARSFNEMANACFKAMGRPSKIEFFDMPESMRERYQYYTCLDLQLLRRAGFRHRFSSFERAIRDYYVNYYAKSAHLGDEPANAKD